ncbi:MAG: cation diffusion facilitator family transporter [Candidatus Eremiobacteraeota bacterium]|nr:cation diffusion facilitator family transporter [Candidatus Eremiobacteraeota bacterium]
MQLAFGVTLCILMLEAAGGFVSHSLALLTDAAHMLTDVGAAALGLWTANIALRQIDKRHTFGYGRATILAALANAVALFAIVLFLIYEAVIRLYHPEPVRSGIMMVVAAVALIANLALTWLLTRGETGSLNVKAVVAHVMGDAAISGAVIVAAGIIFFTNALVVDPLVSLLAAIVVSSAAWSVVRDSLRILMEGTPQGLDIAHLKTYLMENAQIDEVHDLHVWCVSDQKTAASLHVRVPQTQLVQAPQTVARVKRLLREKFGVEHCTVEVECDNCEGSC